MKFIKKTVILSCPNGGEYDCLKMESRGSSVLADFSPSENLRGCVIGIKEKNSPIRIFPLSFPMTSLHMSDNFLYGDFAEFIIVNLSTMTVSLYGNTHSTYPQKLTLLDGFSTYAKDMQSKIKSKREQSEKITDKMSEKIMDRVTDKISKSEGVAQTVLQWEERETIGKIVPEKNKESTLKNEMESKQRNTTNTTSTNFAQSTVVKAVDTTSTNTAQSTVVKAVDTTSTNFAQSTVVKAVDTTSTNTAQSTASNTVEEKNKYEVLENSLEVEANKGYYYDGIKADIEEMLAQKPSVPELCALIEGSKWAKIENDEGYIIGVIYDKGAPIFVCYGLVGIEKECPGDEYVFVETTLGKGYWLIYQNAATGEIVSKSKKNL